MVTAALISVEEYLATSYRSDCDYVDGQLLERNLGTKDYRKLQRRLILWCENRRRELRLATFPEERIRVAPRLQNKFDEFLNTPAGHREALEGILRSTDGRVVLPVADLFQPDEI